MTEIIERVAQAIYRAQKGRDASEEFWTTPATGANFYRDMARAAIAAMREPTEAMIDASPIEGVAWDKYSRGYATDCYRAMIDAAIQANKYVPIP